MITKFQRIHEKFDIYENSRNPETFEFPCLGPQSVPQSVPLPRHRAAPADGPRAPLELS